MTGFDVPSCSTIYLDKPMKNHTLMQTIARANRVFRDKVNGLIVDYVGIFRNLKEALFIYGSGARGGTTEGESPIQEKAELLALLQRAVDEAVAFCHKCGVEPKAIQEAKGFERVSLLKDAVDKVIVTDDSKRQFISLANNVARIFKAILPDSRANALAPVCALLRAMHLSIESTSAGC